MLTKFSVKNFKAFKEKVTLDLSKPRDYSFNSHLIRNGVVNNGIIYGKNGSGKTSIGKAIFDIVSVIGMPNRIDYATEIYQGYKQLPIEFEYSFLFDGDEITYSYTKNNSGRIIDEALLLNNKQIFRKSVEEGIIEVSQEFHFDDKRKDDLLNSANSISIFNYLQSTFPLAQGHYMLKMVAFINSMLWFRCLEDRNYIGFDNARVNIEEYLIKHNRVEQFAEFLQNESEQKFDFSATNADDIRLKCLIDGNVVDFSDIKSTGTSSLELLFYWLVRIDEKHPSFIFIDEFDAFYHFELSINICKTLFGKDYQAFLSSHNTLLLGNDYLRPDCALYLQNGQLHPLSDLTNRGELRQGHNIEKMFRGGSFNQKVL